MFRSLLGISAGLVLFASTTSADEKDPLEFKLVVKKESIAWPYEFGPKELEGKLKDIIKQKAGNLPKPPAIAIVGQITNNGKEKITIYVEGDPNTLTLTLKGPGVATANPDLASTTEFRLPKAVVLGPGKSHEIAITSLADGFRRAGRYNYPTAPGEYTLSATYQLTNAEGAKGPLLKSGEVKFKVEEPR